MTIAHLYAGRVVLHPLLVQHRHGGVIKVLLSMLALVAHVAIGTTTAVYSLAHGEEDHSHDLLLAYQALVLALSTTFTIALAVTGLRAYVKHRRAQLHWNGSKRKDSQRGSFALTFATVVGPWTVNTAIAILCITALVHQPRLYQVILPLEPYTHRACHTLHDSQARADVPIMPLSVAVVCLLTSFIKTACPPSASSDPLEHGDFSPNQHSHSQHYQQHRWSSSHLTGSAWTTSNHLDPSSQSGDELNKGSHQRNGFSPPAHHEVRSRLNTAATDRTAIATGHGHASTPAPFFDALTPPTLSMLVPAAIRPDQIQPQNHLDQPAEHTPSPDDGMDVEADAYAYSNDHDHDHADGEGHMELMVDAPPSSPLPSSSCPDNNHDYRHHLGRRNPLAQVFSHAARRISSTLSGISTPDPFPAHAGTGTARAEESSESQAHYQQGQHQLQHQPKRWRRKLSNAGMAPSAWRGLDRWAGASSRQQHIVSVDHGDRLEVCDTPPPCGSPAGTNTTTGAVMPCADGSTRVARRGDNSIDSLATGLMTSRAAAGSAPNLLAGVTRAPSVVHPRTRVDSTPSGWPARFVGKSKAPHGHGHGQALNGKERRQSVRSSIISLTNSSSANSGGSGGGGGVSWFGGRPSTSAARTRAGVSAFPTTGRPKQLGAATTLPQHQEHPHQDVKRQYKALASPGLPGYTDSQAQAAAEAAATSSALAVPSPIAAARPSSSLLVPQGMQHYLHPQHYLSPAQVHSNGHGRPPPSPSETVTSTSFFSSSRPGSVSAVAAPVGSTPQWMQPASSGHGAGTTTLSRSGCGSGSTPPRSRGQSPRLPEARVVGRQETYAAIVTPANGRGGTSASAMPASATGPHDTAAQAPLRRERNPSLVRRKAVPSIGSFEELMREDLVRVG